MTLEFINLIQTASETLPTLAQEATDVHGYVKAVAQSLQDQKPSLFSAYDVVQAPPEATDVVLVPIFESPYIAVQLSMSEEDPTYAPLLQMWGRAVAGAWEQYGQANALRLLEQLTTITEELWENADDDDKALGLVCRRIVDAMPGIDRVSVLMRDDDPSSGTVVAAFPTDTVGQLLRLDTYDLYQRLMQEKTPIAINDAKQERDIFGPNQSILAAFAVRSILIVPLFVEGELAGSIGFDAINQHHYFSAEEVRLLQSVVNQIALYLKQGRSQQGSSSELDVSQQRLVEQVMQSIPLRSDIETLMLRTAESIGTTLRASAVNVYLNTNIEESSQKQKAD